VPGARTLDVKRGLIARSMPAAVRIASSSSSGFGTTSLARLVRGTYRAVTSTELLAGVVVNGWLIIALFGARGISIVAELLDTEGRAEELNRQHSYRRQFGASCPWMCLPDGHSVDLMEA
jgi:hypothetical protein